MTNKIVFAAIVLFAALALMGCNKINIPGNLAGQVLNQAGQGQGYITVAAIDNETGVEAARMTAEDGGNFFFEKLEAGIYTIKTYSMAGVEMPNDSEPVALGAGRTETAIIYLIPQE